MPVVFCYLINRVPLNFYVFGYYYYACCVLLPNKQSPFELLCVRILLLCLLCFVLLNSVPLNLLCVWILLLCLLCFVLLNSVPLNLLCVWILLLCLLCFVLLNRVPLNLLCVWILLLSLSVVIITLTEPTGVQSVDDTKTVNVYRSSGYVSPA